MKRLTDDQKKARKTFDKRYSEQLDLQADKVELGAAPIDFTEEQRKAWDLHVSIVNPLKVFTPADAITFREMVLLYAIMNESRMKFYAQPVIETSSTTKVNPEYDIYKAALDRWIDLAREFGMSPRSRNKFMMPLTKTEMRQEEGKKKLTAFLESKPTIK